MSQTKKPVEGSTVEKKAILFCSGLPMLVSIPGTKPCLIKTGKRMSLKERSRRKVRWDGG